MRRVRVHKPQGPIEVSGNSGGGPLDCIVVPLRRVDRLGRGGLEVRATAGVVQEELDLGGVRAAFRVVNLGARGRDVVVRPQDQDRVILQIPLALIFILASQRPYRCWANLADMPPVVPAASPLTVTTPPPTASAFGLRIPLPACPGPVVDLPFRGVRRPCVIEFVPRHHRSPAADDGGLRPVGDGGLRPGRHGGRTVYRRRPFPGHWCGTTPGKGQGACSAQRRGPAVCEHRVSIRSGHVSGRLQTRAFTRTCQTRRACRSMRPWPAPGCSAARCHCGRRGPRRDRS